MTDETHRWKFIRTGGIDQVVIRSGGDIVNLEGLDQKLWVALACPTRGIEMDPRTLDLIDTDHDGRIRPPELIAVSRWVREHFADPDRLLESAEEVPLAAIRTDNEAGPRLAAEARAVLALIGRPEATAITLGDLEARQRTLTDTGLNGDGVVPTGATDDKDTQALIEQVIATVGSVTDRNGRPGVDRPHLETFFQQARALDDWQRKADGDAALLPLGDASLAAAEALAAARSKIDDWFARNALVAYDAHAAAALNPSGDDYQALSDALLVVNAPAIAALPLATSGPGSALPLRERVNPAWVERIEAFRTRAAEPLLGRPLQELTPSEWQEVTARLSACSGWLSARPDTPLVGWEPSALKALLAGDAEARLDALIRRDADIEPSNERIVELEKLIRFQRDLVRLLNNFVSFSQFYSRHGGLFEAGTLYLDSRSCDLAVAVDDAGKHAKLAGRAKLYLAYCDCRRGAERRQIAAAFTAGGVDELFVGRNGVFYDRKGQDWDATITQVIENPISIRQAFFLPYKKFLRMIEEQVAKRAAEREKKADSSLGALVTRPAEAARPGGAAVDATQRRIDVGTVAALGVALGSISAVLVGVFAQFVGLGAWIPVAIVGIVMAISGPSMLIAWLKLRLRSLGPLLDASGWAINGRMRINVPLGGMLTERAALPPHSDRRLRDPYRESRLGRWLVLLAVVAVGALVVAWRMGLLGALPVPG